MEAVRAVILGNEPVADHGWGGLDRQPFLTPVANRPVLFHALSHLRDAGVSEAIVAVDQRGAEVVRAAVEDAAPWGMRTQVVVSPGGWPPEATVAALEPMLADTLVLVTRPDAVVFGGLDAALAHVADAEVDAAEMCLTSDGRTAGWLIGPGAVRMVAGGSGRRPVGILDAVRREGGAVGLAPPVDGVLVCGSGTEGLLAANRRLLRALELPEGDRTDAVATGHGSQLQGPVLVDPSARLERTLVRGPAVVGPGTRLVDAYVGPYTSIGADVIVEGSEIEHSVVMDRARISFIGHRLETSVIGRGARVVRRFELPSAVRLCLGAGAEVAL